MRRTLLALPLAALAVAGWHTTHAIAQETKTARGQLTAIGADSETVRVSDQDMKFGVDAKTRVQATGGSTKTRQAVAAKGGKDEISDLVHAGDRVSVSYQETGSTLRAAEIRVTVKAGPGPK